MTRAIEGGRLTILVLALLVAFFILLITNKPNELLTAPLYVEQKVACVKGCQFMTQPMYNITLEKNIENRIWQYDACVDMCTQRYEEDDTNIVVYTDGQQNGCIWVGKWSSQIK